MLVKSVAALAALSLATGVAAEPLRPYKPAVMVKMSTRALFGVVRRDDAPGYQPSTEVCGVGPTCAAACGAGYETCASGDDEVHCFNPSAGEICCPNRSGSSCDAGYYCAADSKGETWCCPEGQSLTDCAASYKEVEGELVSQTPVPETSTSTSSTKTSSSTTKTTSSAAAKTTAADDSDDSDEETTTRGSSFAVTATRTSTRTATAPSTSEPTEDSSEPKEDENAAGRAIVAPATAALAVIAAGFVALL